jgi:hypothetical protein
MTALSLVPQLLGDVVLRKLRSLGGFALQPGIAKSTNKTNGELASFHGTSFRIWN